MGDKSEAFHTHVEGLKSVEGLSENERRQSLILDNTIEHELTFKHIARHHKRLIWWSFYFAMCAVGWGFDAQINGAMISVPAFRRDFGYIYHGEPVLPANWQTAFNVVSSAGQFFGGFLCSYVADKIGRKKSIAVGVLICSGGIIGQITTTSRGGFLASKIVLGLGLGFYLTLGPLCCSETAPVVLRGISTAGVNLGIALGQLISNGVIKGFGQRTDHWAYRGPFAIQLFFAAFLAIGLIFAPESPWWLVRQNRIEDARKALSKLYGSKVNLDLKISAIRSTIEQEQLTEKGTWLECFQGINRLRTGISCGVFACQHLVGIIFVLGYSTYTCFYEVI